MKFVLLSERYGLFINPEKVVAVDRYDGETRIWVGDDEPFTVDMAVEDVIDALEAEDRS